MSQLVREPTRNEYLLDLIITDICKCSVSVLSCLDDHNALLVKLPIPEVLEKSIKREVWILEEADWKKLKQELGNYDWRHLHEGTAETALDYFLEVLWLHLVRHIPRREIETLKSSHPWVTQRSKDAIAEMNNVQNTPQYPAAAEKCEKILAEERRKHVEKVKAKLATLKRGSK